MPALDILAATRAPVWWGRVAITITADLLDVSSWHETDSPEHFSGVRY